MEIPWLKLNLCFGDTCFFVETHCLDDSSVNKLQVRNQNQSIVKLTFALIAKKSNLLGLRPTLIFF